GRDCRERDTAAAARPAHAPWSARMRQAAVSQARSTLPIAGVWRAPRPPRNSIGIRVGRADLTVQTKLAGPVLPVAGCESLLLYSLTAYLRRFAGVSRRRRRWQRCPILRSP